MRRNIFLSTEIKTIQQGSIFYGGIADGIPHPVHGVIITPRCDIANEKVTNVNYLPITTLNDWITNDLIPNFRAEVSSKKMVDLTNRLKKRGVKINLDEKYKISIDSIKKILPEPKDKKLISEIISYWELFDNKVCQEKIKEWGKYDSRISELCKGKMERYLLLEHWAGLENQYYVINLTQVKHISYELSKKLVTGIDTRLINQEKDDLFLDDKPIATKYKVVAQLTSPYIEYVCQKFSNAFFRIGIENWPHNNITDLVKGSI